MTASRKHALIASLAVLAGTTFSIADPKPDDWIEIPVVVNIYKDCSVTEDEAKAYIERANEVLKQAKIKLKTTKTNTGFTVGNGDANQAESEDEEAEKKGKEELEAANKGKGIKINFCNDPIYVAGRERRVNGWAKHKSPVTFVAESDTTEKSGNTVAHEICHILTINYDLYADANKDRLMYGYDDRTGTRLTEAEIEEIRREAAKRGDVVKKEDAVTPSEPKRKESAFGFNFDPASPMGHMGVRDASVTSLEGDVEYECRIVTGGFWPGGTQNYLMLFDIDNNPFTGQNFAGFQGVERALILNPAPPPMVQVEIQALNLVSPPSNFVTQGMRTTEFQFIDVDQPPAVLPEPYGDVYDFRIPISWVSIGPSPLMTVHVASGGPGGIVDRFSMEHDRIDGDRGPFVLTSDGEIDAASGEPVQITGTLFPPNTLVEIELDDLDLVSVMTGPLGDFNIPVVLDPATPTDPYFLTASDPLSGAFGFAVINVLGAAPCPADLSGSADPNDPLYGVPDGTVDAADFFYYLDQFVAANLAVADLSGSADPNDPAYGVPDGTIDSSDFFYYLDIFVAGCP